MGEATALDGQYSKSSQHTAAFPLASPLGNKLITVFWGGALAPPQTPHLCATASLLIDFLQRQRLLTFVQPEGAPPIVTSHVRIFPAEDNLFITDQLNICYNNSNDI